MTDEPAHIQDSGKLTSMAAEAAHEQAMLAGDDACAKASAKFSAATQDVSKRQQLQKASQEVLKRMVQSVSMTLVGTEFT